MILQTLARNWWLLLLRGILAVLFGVLAFVWPGITLLALATLFGIYALVDGATALAAAFTGAGAGSRAWLVVAGILGLGAGLVALAWPGMTAILLVMLIGACALARGVFEIVAAIQLRKEIDNEWTLIALGALSVVFGLIVLVAPGAGALALVWLIGGYAIAFGALLIGLSLRLKGHVATPA
jgi:uncharacterized membrane protein HdeD (DUF308 family)